MLILLLAQFFSLFVGIISYKKASISLSGLIALLLISALFIWTGETGLLFSLFYMFASSSLLTKYKKHRKQEFESVVGKPGPRNYVQALCNLGVATAGLLLYLWYHDEVFIAAIMGSIAAANADSWASEIGGLSKRTPIMILNFKPVAKGVSGGITLTGTLGGIGGSLFITVAGIATIQWMDPFRGNLLLLCSITFFSGIFGFLFDSVLGALTQVLYKNKQNGQLTEQHSEHAEYVKGWTWMNNDMVNFITTLVSAIVAGVMYYCVR